MSILPSSLMTVWPSQGYVFFYPVWLVSLDAWLCVCSLPHHTGQGRAGWLCSTRLGHLHFSTEQASRCWLSQPEISTMSAQETRPRGDLGRSGLGKQARGTDTQLQGWFDSSRASYTKLYVVAVDHGRGQDFIKWASERLVPEKITCHEINKDNSWRHFQVLLLVDPWLNLTYTREIVTWPCLKLALAPVIEN